MRRSLLRHLPALAHWFHLKPWDIERCTYAEIDEYIAAIPKAAGA